MSSSNNPFAPTDRMLRQFSCLWIVFFGAIAARQEFHHHRHLVAGIIAGAGLTIGLLGLAWTPFIRPIFIGWMALVYPIGWLVSRIILGMLYYGLFTPVAWIFRMIGRDELRLKPQPDATTYWLPKAPPLDKAQYLRQY